MIKVSKEFLKRIKEAIEEYERLIDGEFGSVRTVEKLIEDGEMPEIWYELVAVLKCP